MNSVPILMPKEMVNDEFYIVLSLIAASGDKVDKGQALAEMETSKASFVVVSPAQGYFRTSYSEGDSVGVGEMFGSIDISFAATGDVPTAKSADPDPRFSRTAWELLTKSGLSQERFSGFPLVKKTDVEEALRKRAAARLPDPTKLSSEERLAAIILLGGGGHGLECLDILELNNDYGVFGFIDTRAAVGGDICGYPVLGGNEALSHYLAIGIKNLVLAYGIVSNPSDRGTHFRRLTEAGHAFPALIHPKAAVNRRAVLGCGVQVMGCALVGAGAVIGNAGIINSGAVVSHDCRLEDNVHIAPGAILAGGVRVGADTLIGMGATVYMRVRIGQRVVVQNGATVFADVPDGSVVSGEWR